MKRAVPYHNDLMKALSNSTEAAAYLNAVAEDQDIKFLLKALRNVVEAQGGITKLSKKTKLSRTQLYRTLSVDGNPEITTLDAILKVYNIRIGFYSEEQVQRRHAA